MVRDFYAQLSEFERRVRSGNLSATATEQLHVMSTDLQLLDRRFKVKGGGGRRGGAQGAWEGRVEGPKAI